MLTMQTCKGVVAGLAMLGTVELLTTDSLAVQKFSDWSEPVNLGPLVNSAFTDSYPAISNKGLSLYLASTRPGSVGDVPNADIWVARRATVNDPWGPPVNLGSNINTTFVEDAPAISRDGHWLFFDSTRPDDAHGGLDHWVSWRAHTDDDFGWLPAVNLGPGINTSFLDAGPAPFENDDVGIPLLFFVSNRLNPASGGNGNDIYVAERTPNGTYEGVLLVDELNSPLGEFRPTIRYDGLEIVFGSNRPLEGISGFRLWMSSRTTVFDPWSSPVSLGTIINSGAFENTPYLSPDGRELYFSAFRADRLGGSDLYVSTRSRRTGR